MPNSPSWCGKYPDVMQFNEQYVLYVCVFCVRFSVGSASAPVASASEASSSSAPEAAALFISEIANGCAELAAGGIVDLPRVPPGLRRDLFVCAAARANVLSGRALGRYCL